MSGQSGGSASPSPQDCCPSNVAPRMVPERDKISIFLLHTVPAYRILTHKMSTANIFNCGPRSPLLLLGEALNLGVFHLQLDNSRRKSRSASRYAARSSKPDTQILRGRESRPGGSTGSCFLEPLSHEDIISFWWITSKAGPLKLNPTRAKASAIDADILSADLRPSCWSRRVHVGLLSLVSGVLSVVQ